MAESGISRIDNLLQGQGEELLPGEEDKEAVGLVQDLLIGHGFTSLPGLLGNSRGIYGPKTTDAVMEFQRDHGLSDTGAVDAATLQALITAPAAKPIASRGYLTLVLDLVYAGMTRLMCITSQFEGAGRFSAINRNSDRAGLSFGLIQWAQKPGRLRELLILLHSINQEVFTQIFSEGDPDLVQGLLDHVAKPWGGTDDHGHTIDPAFNLVEDPWLSRFKEAALSRELQRGQVMCATDAFTRSYKKLRNYASMLESERAVAFMLDLANQHGNGGARNIFEHVYRPGLSEEEILRRLQEESIARVRHQFGEGPEVTSTRNRRKAFRTTPLLSDTAVEF